MGAKKFPAAPSYINDATMSEKNHIMMKKFLVPHMTKSILPNFSIAFFTAPCRVCGSRTSAWAGMHVRPVVSDSSLAASINLSSLGQLLILGGALFCQAQEELTSAQLSRHLHHDASRKNVRARFMHMINFRPKLSAPQLAIASVIPRHMPEPPPVQKSTFPLKISCLKIEVELVMGAT